MITIDPNSKDTEISQIINQWTEITDLKAQWQRISNNTVCIEIYLRNFPKTSARLYLDCINALTLLSQCPNSEEKNDIEIEILRDLYSLLDLCLNTTALDTITEYQNVTHEGIWYTIKPRLELIDCEDYPSLIAWCAELNVLSQCPNSEEKRQLETKAGLDLLDYIY